MTELTINGINFELQNEANWDNGSTLGVAYGYDEVKKV